MEQPHRKGPEEADRHRPHQSADHQVLVDRSASCSAAQPEQPDDGDQASKDQHRNVSSGDRFARRPLTYGKGLLSHKSRNVIDLNRAVVVDAVHSGDRVELLELWCSEAYGRTGLARCDVGTVQRQPFGETSVSDDVTDVILPDKREIRRRELLIEEQRRRVVRPVQRRHRFDVPDVVEQSTVVAIDSHMRSGRQMGADPIGQRE